MSNDLLNLAIQEILDTYDAILWNDNYYNDVVQAIFNVYIQDFFQRTGWNSATTKKFFYEYYKKKAIDRFDQHLQLKKQLRNEINN